MSALARRDLSGTCWRRTALSGSPTHLLLEVTSRYMSVGEPDYAPPTAVSKHLSDSKDVNNCLELSTRACILIFNDNFALAKSVLETRTDTHTRRLL